VVRSLAAALTQAVEDARARYGAEATSDSPELFGGGLQTSHCRAQFVGTLNFFSPGGVSLSSTKGG